jgi:hypothetical protein
MKNKATVISMINSYRNDLDSFDNLYVIANDYWDNRWNDVIHCVQYNKPIYMCADTQCGKTFYKLVLAFKLLQHKLVTNVVINTTSLTSAKDQMFSRVRQYFMMKGIDVKITDDHNIVMMPGNVIVNMTNASRTNKLTKLINDAEDIARMQAKETKTKPVYPRIMILRDEGEEFSSDVGNPSSGIKSSACDRELFNLINTRNTNQTSQVYVAEISATLYSHIMLHNQFTSTHGYLENKQIFELPYCSHYKGIRTVKDIIDDSLVEETPNVFGNDQYKNTANLRNTQNFKIVVDKIDQLICQNPYGLVQIGNVVLGVSKNSHRIASELLSRQFINKQYSVEIWDQQSIQELNTECEIVIVIQNGDTDQNTISEKFMTIADNWNRKNLKAILVVAKKMTSKSITLEVPGWDIVKSPYFGFYANFTVFYGPRNGNVADEIQFMRCTGNRPALKTHRLITTERTKIAIEGYYKEQANLISLLNQQGQLSTDFIMKRLVPIGKRKAKGSINQALNGNQHAVKRIENSDRDIHAQSGLTLRDMIIPITSRQMSAIQQNRTAMRDFALDNGFMPCGLDYDDIIIRKQTVYKSQSDARNAIRNGTKAAKVVFSYHQKGKRFFVYAYNKEYNGSYARYKMEIDSLGNCIFPYSEISMEKDNVIVDVV